MSKVFNSQGVVLEDGTTIPLYCGEFHYWHHSQESWGPTLDSLKELGLGVITTCVPWSEHEEKRGEYNFTGELDLGAFLDAVKHAGLYAIVRLGPAVGADLTCAGLPDHIVSQPEIAARSCRSTPIQSPFPPKFFPLPSFASEKFQDEVSRWFAVVGKIIAPRLLGEGAVLAVSVDPGEDFQRMGAYESDYHPDALAWWHEFSDGQSPPRSFSGEGMADALQWMHFKEEYCSKSLAWLRQAAESAGMSPCCSRMAASSPAETMLVRAQNAVDGAVSIGFDEVASSYERVRERSIYLSSSSSLPWADPLPIGGSFYKPVRSERQERNILLGALAGGVVGFTLQMAVSRPRWQGGAIDSESRKREVVPWVRSLLSGLARVQFHILKQARPSIAIVVSRTEMRVATASVAVDALPSALSELMQLGPSGHAELSTDTSAQTYPKWVRAVQKALDLCQLPYQLVDEECLHLLDNSTKAVIFPTLKRVNGGTWAALHALSAAGIRIVIGPEMPSEDEFGQNLGQDCPAPRGVGMLAHESLSDIEGLSEDLLGLAGDLDDLWIAPGNQVHCSLFENETGEAKALFVGNPETESQEVMVNVPVDVVLEDVLTGERFPSVDGVASFSLDDGDLRFFVVSS
ncbi:MAG: beta-galactosidase [Kofleriaceae bacterium]|nr:beta-galactosidase [Kofleriaceae bacterium]